MHGEHKTPGGKMVVVDFSVAEGALYGVQVSGDFFLYPEEALQKITAALEGLPTLADSSMIAESIRRFVAPNVVMLGFSPEAIGLAIRSALDPNSSSEELREKG